MKAGGDVVENDEEGEMAEFIRDDVAAEERDADRSPTSFRR